MALDFLGFQVQSQQLHNVISVINSGIRLAKFVLIKEYII